jgi:hypothetical protein
VEDVRHAHTLRTIELGADGIVVVVFTDLLAKDGVPTAPEMLQPHLAHVVGDEVVLAAVADEVAAARAVFVGFGDLETHGDAAAAGVRRAGFKERECVYVCREVAKGGVQVGKRSGEEASD